MSTFRIGHVWNRGFAVLLAALHILLVQVPLRSQSIVCDFGVSEGLHSSGESSTFLPAPVIGTARVRIGTQGGSARLLNPGNPVVGGASELAIEGPTGSSLNKFSMYDLTAGASVTMRFDCGVSGGRGEWYLFIGSGTTYAGNTGFSGAQTFTGLRWIIDSLGGVTLSVRSGSAWTILNVPISRDSLMRFDVYCNNNATSGQYSYHGGESVTAHCVDIWLNGTLIANDIVKAGLSDTTLLNAFMIYGSSSPNNGSTFSIDEITWLPSIAQQPLPVELSEFTAVRRGTDVDVRWTTETEMNCYGFAVERRATADGKGWTERGFLQGAGNSNTARQYSYRDVAVSTDTSWEYRLRQIDRDGTVEYSKVLLIAAEATEGHHLFEPPYPNPALDHTYFRLTLIAPARVRLRLYSSSGLHVYDVPIPCLLPAGRHSIAYRCTDLPRGLYYCLCDIGGVTNLQPILLL
ncbi:MAG: hypothetical protein M5R41_05690 [Bacteroidia bacterium]|nr:hypothetical protein [Bacteroidia bacterium]